MNGLGRVDHVAVRVHDPDALDEFLTTVLGLTRQGSRRRALYSLPGGVTLAVFGIGEEQGGLGDRAQGRLPDHMAFRVDDMAQWASHLASRGYPLEGDMVMAPGGLCLQFVEG